MPIKMPMKRSKKMNRKINLVAALAALLVLMTAPAAFALQNDYAEDVSHFSDPSPSQTESGINNYVYQDEQINLDKETGTLRVLRTDQKVNINDYVTEVITLDNACPRELRGLVRTITRKEGGDADTLWDKYNRQTGTLYSDWHDCGKNLVVVCPDFQIPYIKKTLKAIDKEWVKEVNDGSWTLYYKAKHRDVQDIMNILFLYATPDASFDIDVTNNAVLRFDQPCIQPLFEKGLREVDIPPSQLSLDVEIYEVSKYDDLNFGVDFQAWKNGPGARLFRFAFYNEDARFSGGETTIPDRNQDWWKFSSYDFTLTSAFVDFLRTKGKAKLMTETTITAKSGKAAGLSVTNGVVSFVNNQSEDNEEAGNGEGEGEGGNADVYEFENTDPPAIVSLPNWTSRELSYKATGQTGVKLAIAPVVGLESAELDIILQVDDIAGYMPSGDPIISQRYLSSTFEVRDQEPIIFGGISKTADIEETVGVPYLMNIPLVGKYVFGRTVNTTDETKMVVYLTPHFDVFAMDDTSIPQVVKTAEMAAKDLKDIAYPKTDMGYDQWLMDRSAD